MFRLGRLCICDRIIRFVSSCPRPRLTRMRVSLKRKHKRNRNIRMRLHMADNMIRENGLRAMGCETASLTLYHEMRTLSFVKVMQRLQEGSRDGCGISSIRSLVGQTVRFRVARGVTLGCCSALLVGTASQYNEIDRRFVGLLGSIRRGWR